MLLGIPLPSIFVSQRDDGKWELIDGLQRLSTILQFVGILKSPDGQLMERLVLHGTKLLPSLKGKYWTDEDSSDDPESLPSTEKLLIKRSRIQVQIIKKESDASSKFELFQRLNALGAPLEPMEIRNSLISMIDPKFAGWIKSLADDPNFRECIDLSDNQMDELYDRELVCRFFAFKQVCEEELRNIDDIADFVDDSMVKLISDKTFDQDKEGKTFRATFQIFKDQLGEDSFRRFDTRAGKFKGGFLVSAFEVLALGLGYMNPLSKTFNQQGLAQIAKDLWENPVFQRNSGAGVSASRRVRQSIPLGRKLISG
jgi:hypothetical protein